MILRNMFSDKEISKEETIEKVAFCDTSTMKIKLICTNNRKQKSLGGKNFCL